MIRITCAPAGLFRLAIVALLVVSQSMWAPMVAMAQVGGKREPEETPDQRINRLWTEAKRIDPWKQEALEAKLEEMIDVRRDSPDVWARAGKIWWDAFRNDRWRLAIGVSEFLSGDYPNAREHLSQVIASLVPSADANANARRMAMAFRLRGLSNAELRDYEQAWSDLEMSLELSPEERTYRHYAAALVSAREFDKAIEIFDRAITALPDSDHSQLRFERRRAVAASGRVEQALKQLDADGAGDPILRDLERAMLLHEAKRWAEAHAAYQRVLERAPESTNALVRRARVSTELGQFEAALKDCDEALRIDPNYHWARGTRARTLFMMEHDEQAIREMTEMFSRGLLEANELAFVEKIAARSPRIAAAHGLEGRMHSRLAYDERLASDKRIDHARRALAALDRCAALNGMNKTHWHDHGRALTIIGKPEQAMRSFDQALKLDPTAGYALLAKARALLALRRYDDALAAISPLKDWLAAKGIRAEFDPEHKEISKIEALALLGKGSKENTFEAWKIAYAVNQNLFSFDPEMSLLFATAFLENARHETTHLHRQGDLNHAQFHIEEAIAMRPLDGRYRQAAIPIQAQIYYAAKDADPSSVGQPDRAWRAIVPFSQTNPIPKPEAVADATPAPELQPGEPKQDNTGLNILIGIGVALAIGALLTSSDNAEETQNATVNDNCYICGGTGHQPGIPGSSPSQHLFDCATCGGDGKLH